MDALNQLINLLSSSDKKDFRQSLQKKNKRDDVKNIRLFDLLETDDINGVKKLYKSSKNKDAYHALRKRLHDSLLLFLSQKTFENSQIETYDTLRLIVVSRFLLENNLTKTAFKCLDKAERLATKLEQFNLQNEILLLKLQYAHIHEAENLDLLTARFLSNQQQMQREAKLNLAYAFLRQELQDIQLKGKIVNLSALIISTVRKYKIAVDDLMTYKSLYQILFIANEYAAIYQNYSLIERYIKRSYQFIQRQEQTNDSHLFYRLSILYFLANFYLRNKSFAESMIYLDQMLPLMDVDKSYKSLFHLRHQLLLGLNLHFTGQPQAGITILREALQSVDKKSRQEDIDDLQICLVMFLAQHHDRSCLRQLALLTHTDAWYEKKLGMLWTIRKNLMEILIHTQFEQIELAVSRLQSFKRRYRKYLITTREERVLYFIGLIEKYLNKPGVVFDTLYQNAVLDLLKSEENYDIFNLSFISWLIAIWQKKTSYQVVLELIGRKTN